jgi:hypothetical protein
MSLHTPWNGGLTPLILNHGIKWRWSVSHPSLLTSWGGALGTHLIRGQVGARAGLDVLENRYLAPTGIQTPDCLARSVVIILTRLYRITTGTSSSTKEGTVKPTQGNTNRQGSKLYQHPTCNSKGAQRGTP